MKMDGCRIALGLMILAGLLESGCHRETEQNSTVSTQATGAFELNILSRGHDTTLYINGEPAGWASASAKAGDERDILIRGFPIHAGSNSYSITVTPDYPTNYVSPRYGNPYISLLSYSQESEKGIVQSGHWRSEDTFKDDLPESNCVSWDASFDISAPVSDPDFDLVDSNTNVYINQVQSYTVKLAKLFETQDADGLAHALGFANAKSWHAKYNANSKIQGEDFFFNQVSLADQILTNVIDSASITNEPDLDVEIGKRLILVYSDSGDHLAQLTFSNGKLHCTKFVDYFTFARKQGKWMVAWPTTDFFELNISDDGSLKQ